MNSFVLDWTFSEVQKYFVDLGEPDYRADQFWKGIYQHLWLDPGQFTTFSKDLRQQLDVNLDFTHLQAEKVLSSEDQSTEKILYRLPDGKAIETVLMRYEDRNTVCISSQVGCGMGCDFCATGTMGLIRNLSRGEIVEQVLRAQSRLAVDGLDLTNVVFMGMGEPFNNYQEVMAAVEVLNDTEGFNFGIRRFTISTVGLVPGIKRFTEEDSQINLAVSLHAADNALRNSMMKINRKYPLEILIPACREYTEKTGRRVTFEWALIHKVNDTEKQAKKLAKLIGDMLAHVNVIPLNPNQHYPGEPSSNHRVKRFQNILQEHGVPCTIRIRRGVDIQAGCGQLASEANL
jgi:23S rRNA (adenine2503-C2)-methyltransferase